MVFSKVRDDLAERLAGLEIAQASFGDTKPIPHAGVRSILSPEPGASMRIATFAGAVASITIVLCGAPAGAADKVPVVARAEACVRANVDRVVAVETDLQSAATFLVTYVCANETAGAARYERNTAWLVSMRGFLKASDQMMPNSVFGSEIDAMVDPETGEFVIPPAKPGAKPNPMAAMLPQMSTQSAMMLPDTPSASLRKLAGDLVLAARERQVSGKRR